MIIDLFRVGGQIGSFGAITRITSIVPKREVLLKVAAAGPLAGFSLGLILFLLGFILPPSDGVGLLVDASVFHESFLAGGIGELFVWVHTAYRDFLSSCILLHMASNVSKICSFHVLLYYSSPQSCSFA